MKRPSKRLQILLAVTLLLYACGYLTQFIGNYAVWQKNGGMPGGTSPPFPSLSPPDCLKGILWFPYNLYCIAGCAATVAAIFLYRKLFSQDALTDSERNFDFSGIGEAVHEVARPFVGNLAACHEYGAFEVKCENFCSCS